MHALFCVQEIEKFRVELEATEKYRNLVTKTDAELRVLADAVPPLVRVKLGGTWGMGYKDAAGNVFQGNACG